MSLSGYTYFFLLNENVQLYELSIVGFTSLSSIFVVPFIRLFLKTKQFLPKLDRFIPVLIISYMVALVFVGVCRYKLCDHRF